MARIAIVGVGAIGGVLAGLLHTTKQHELLLCTRRPLPSLRIETPEELITVEGKNLLPEDQNDVAPMDWILVATKAYDVPAAANWLKFLRKKDTPVAIIQNGVEHRERFAQYVPEEYLVPVVIDCATERQADGLVRQRGVARMKVEKNRLGESYVELFTGSQADFLITEDFVSEAWRKLCLNAAGALSALTAKPSIVFQDELIGKAALDIVAECLAVAQAEGAKLEKDLPQQVLSRCHADAPDSVNSMLADRLAGRRMEIDARNGVIVRKGEKHGIATPANQVVVALLHEIERTGKTE